MSDDWFPTRAELENPDYELSDRQLAYAEQERQRWIRTYSRPTIPQHMSIYAEKLREVKSLSPREVLLQSFKLKTLEKIESLQRAHERTGRDSDPSHKYMDCDSTTRKFLDGLEETTRESRDAHYIIGQKSA